MPPATVQYWPMAHDWQSLPTGHRPTDNTVYNGRPLTFTDMNIVQYTIMETISTAIEFTAVSYVTGNLGSLGI